MKRTLDVILAGVILIVTFPLCVLAAMAIKLDSPGPVVFRQRRVGRGGHVFTIFKFRTMLTHPYDDCAPEVLPQVTRVGVFLRWSKLDELPQLWNVLAGHMSMVGPRPEVPTWVAEYPPEARKVLAVRPGITDVASIIFRHEERVIRKAAASRGLTAADVYREEILPVKLRLQIWYCEHRSMRLDCLLLLLTGAGVFAPGAAERSVKRLLLRRNFCGKNPHGGADLGQGSACW